MILINLFSVFDPTSYFSLPFNWVIALGLYILFPVCYYTSKRFNQIGVGTVSSKIAGMFKEVARNDYFGFVFISVVTFLYLVIGNVLGLFPFVFTFTAHPIITIGVGLVFWLSFFMIGWIKNFKNSAAHLVPEGSPIYLSPIIVLIESISHLIRPFTLSIRLAANIIAGHLIISLLASIRLLRRFGFISSLIFQRILLILEFGVSVIQGFVFRILLLLYALEYY